MCGDRWEMMRASRSALAELGVASKGGGRTFDRDRAIEAGVEGFVDLAHSAGADQRHDLVGDPPIAGARDMPVCLLHSARIALR
jgi:hypothetical protein